MARRANAVYITPGARVVLPTQLCGIVKGDTLRLDRKVVSVPRVWEILCRGDTLFDEKYCEAYGQKIPILVLLPLDRRRNTAYNRAVKWGSDPGTQRERAVLPPARLGLYRSTEPPVPPRLRAATPSCHPQTDHERTAETRRAGCRDEPVDPLDRPVGSGIFISPHHHACEAPPLDCPSREGAPVCPFRGEAR